MKRLVFLFSAVAFLWGCEKVEHDDPVKEDTTVKEETPDNDIEDIPDSLVTDYVLPEVLYASVSAEDDKNEEEDKPQTRTYVDKSNRVLWQNGDAISYFAGNTHNARYIYNGEDGLETVELSKDDQKPGSTGGSVLLKSQAIYPYNENISVVYEDGVDKINLTYPATQKYAVNSFGKDANIMVAMGSHNTDDNLNFRNACGYLIIKLYGSKTTIKSMTVSSVDGTDKIAGPAVIVANNDAAPVITMAANASTALTLDCSNDGAGVALGPDAENATEFWFCLPPVTFKNGIKVSVTDVYDNTYSKQTNKTVEIIRNEIQPMAALEFISNTPAATKLWYTRSDNSRTPLTFYDDQNPFNAKISGHYWDSSLKQFVIEFSSPLTTIKKEAFRETEIGTITLPEGITTIEESAFEDSHLMGITIPGSMNNIGINVFYDCARLKSVTFLPSPTKTPLRIGCLDWGSEWGPFYDSPLTSINLNRELICVWEDGTVFTPGSWDQGMFANQYHDEVSSVSVTLGSQVETLSNYMFARLPIQNLTIPGTMKKIGNDVFYDCTSLSSLTFLPSQSGAVLTMGYDTEGEDENLFQDNQKLATLNLDREIVYTLTGVDTPSEGLFGGIPSLKNVTLGEQVKTLLPYMFAGSGITSIDLKNVETISNHAFINTGITSLTVPGSVNTIGNNVFDGCTALKTLTFEPSDSGRTLTVGYNDDSSDESLFVDSPLVSVNLNREINYTYPISYLNEASEGLFGNKPTLKSVTLGDQVKTLLPYMFAGTGIKSIDLKNVETISNHVFANTGITSLTVPGSVNTIANDVFYSCTSLSSLTFLPSQSGEALTMGYDTYGEAENLFQDNQKLATLNLDREIVYTLTGVDTPSEGLFGGIPSLKNVTLGDQVKTLSSHMFALSAITELEIPGSVNTIGNNVFDGCTALKTLTFEPSDSGKKLTVGYNDDNYDESLFIDSPLETVVLDREVVYTYPDSYLNEPSEGLFGNKSSLKNITIGDQVKTIAPYMFANAGVSANQSGKYELQLNKVTTIARNAFMGTGITHLPIPASVTEIGNNAFVNCESLVEIVFMSSEKPVTIGFQPGTNEHGPFWQSPLNKIVLQREITPSTEYAAACNQDDEGIFANEHSSEIIKDKPAPIVQILSNVKTLHPYMFCGWGMADLNIPASVTEISNDAFSACEKLASITFEESDKPLKIGYNTIGDDDGPFIDSPLTTVVMNREIQYTFPTSDLDSPYEGLFGAKPTLTSITLGQYVRTLPAYIFANAAVTELDLKNVTTIGKGALEGMSKITSLDIPASVTSIDDFAFKNCSSLATLNFLSGSNDLTIGYQPGSDEHGPFYQSPLKSIKLDRQIAMTENYTTYCDQWDEGIFSNEYYNDNVEWVTDLILGPNVKTILKYMFAGTRIQQLHIPETVENIGVSVTENNEKLNAIIFYDEQVRPNVEHGAFGVESNDILNNTVLPPGKGQYYVFVPYRLGRLGSYRGELYYTTDDLVKDTYWDVLHGIMVDDQPDRDGYYQPHKYNESRYLNVPGYEWYKERYYDYITISPPSI